MRLRDRDLAPTQAQLELDVAMLETELAEHPHAVHVRENFMSGVLSGVNGTPTFYGMA